MIFPSPNKIKCMESRHVFMCPLIDTWIHGDSCLKNVCVQVSFDFDIIIN